MATSLTCNMTLLGTFTYTDDNDLSDPKDVTKIDFGDVFANGTSTDQADVIWHDRNTATAAPVDIDLHTSLTDVYGNAATFVTVKGIFIHNRSTTTTEILTVGGDAAPFINWIGAANDTVKIGPDGIFLLWSPINGYAVTNAANDVLQIDPGADTIEYDIVIIGTSA